MRTSISIATLLCLLSSPTVALPLAPGATLSQTDYADFGEVSDGDPDFFGTLSGSFSETATVTRDGFAPALGLVDDLYSVTARISGDVFAATNGGTTFAYEFTAFDDSGTGAPNNGAQVFRVSGFAGYDIDIGWNFDAFPYVPEISRSADGDTISVDYLMPIFFGESPTETILVNANAPAFRTTGGGEADILIDTFGTTAASVSPLPVPSEVPLPAPALLLCTGLGLAGLAARRRRG